MADVTFFSLWYLWSFIIEWVDIITEYHRICQLLQNIVFATTSKNHDFSKVIRFGLYDFVKIIWYMIKQGYITQFLIYLHNLKNINFKWIVSMHVASSLDIYVVLLFIFADISITDFAKCRFLWNAFLR